MLKYYISLGSKRDLGWFGEFPHIENSILVLAVNCCIYKHFANYVSKFCWFVDILYSKSKKCAVQKFLDICFLRFKWKIANIFARLWKSAQFCHRAIFPSLAADRWNRKSQIIPKLGRILKFKPQQCYKLIKTLLQTENEGKSCGHDLPILLDFSVHSLLKELFVTRTILPVQFVTFFNLLEILSANISNPLLFSSIRSVWNANKT